MTVNELTISLLESVRKSLGQPISADIDFLRPQPISVKNVKLANHVIVATLLWLKAT